jgi:hypothetical protein
VRSQRNLGPVEGSGSDTTSIYSQSTAPCVEPSKLWLADVVKCVQHEFAASRRPAARSKPNREPRSLSYSRDDIVVAIRRWAELYGEPPTMMDWEPARARRLGPGWRAERFECDRWPSSRVVRRQFSSFNMAVEAAGYRPRPAPSRQRQNLSGPQARRGADRVDAPMRRWTDYGRLGPNEGPQAPPRLANRSLLPRRLAERPTRTATDEARRRIGNWLVDLDFPNANPSATADVDVGLAPAGRP